MTLTIAFGGLGAALRSLSERLGTDGEYPATIGFCGEILAVVIAPFCVGAALFATLLQRRPWIALTVGIVILSVLLLPVVAEYTGAMMIFGVIAAILVAPTVLVHRHIRTIPVSEVRDRFLATAGWTLINTLLVLLCGLQVNQLIDSALEIQ